MLLRRDVFLKTVNLTELQTLKQAESEEYQSIYFKSNKIGYVINKYSKSNSSAADGSDGWLLDQQAYMQLNVAGTIQDIHLKLKANLAGNNLLKKFAFSFTSPFYKMSATGTVNSNQVNYSLETGTNVINDTLQFDSPPLLSTSRRSYLLSDNIKLGEKRKVPWFDPFTLTGKESVIEYRGKESILIGGRVHKLHHFIETFSGARVSSWLNDSGTIIKEESPAGFVFIKEPKFKALALSTPDKEILSEVAVQLKGSMVVLSPATEKMRYHLSFPDKIELDINGGRQSFQDNIVTINRERLPENTSEMTCSDIGKSLEPSPYIQADNDKIRQLAKKITSPYPDKIQQLQQLANWVYSNLEKRPVLGLPDALTTLESGQGDCNEHAALLAALARAAGIPTRIVVGVTYHKEAFYYHAWNEACLGDSWVSIDTTTNQLPADLTHIRFIQGEMQEQVRIGGLLGRLTIEPIHETMD